MWWESSLVEHDSALQSGDGTKSANRVYQRQEV